jgi:hypothetical protein
MVWERISKLQPKRMLVISNQSRMNYGLITMFNILAKESRTNCMVTDCKPNNCRM